MQNIEIAKKIIKKIQDRGFIAYIAGGYVRDYLLKRLCTDIDIATSATPDELLAIFPEAKKVGLSFGVLLVKEEDISFEIATFRKDLDYEDGRRPNKVIFTSAEEDAKRRSLTINGMFLDPIRNEVHDFVGGQQDLKNKVVRTIGEPKERFFEDRLRMLRAVRFTITLNFTMDEETKKAIQSLAHTFFPSVAVERVWQEMQKIEKHGKLVEAFSLLKEVHLLQVLFPQIKTSLSIVDRFPKDTSLVLYFVFLLEHDQRALNEFAEQYKLSLKDRSLIDKAIILHNEIKNLKTIDKVKWTKLFSDKVTESLLALEDLDNETKETINSLKAHLKKHIKRMEQKIPLVEAKDLLALGVKQGPLLGNLLLEAERIAIEENLETKQDVLDKLSWK